MKKHIYIIVAAAATLTLSCNKEIETPESVDGAGKVTFTATAAQTKTELQGGHTVWSANDQIKVFYGSGGYSDTADIKTGEGTSHATYEATVPIGEDYHAVYPASVTSSLEAAGRLSITIPGEQDGTFGAGHIAVAKGIDKAFHFVNANSFLKITIPAGYRRIVVESVAGEPLSGPISVDLRSDDPVIIPGEGVSNKVEVASTSGLPSGDIYISVLAGVTHSGGLLLKYYDASGLKGSYFLDKPLETEASCIHSFGEFGVTGEYFATLEGAGNKTGINEANAMDISALKALLQMSEDKDKKAAKAIALNGATIHIAAGTYDFQEPICIAFPDVESGIAITIKGAALSSGGTPSTVISGSGHHCLLNLGKNVRATFENISFVDGLGGSSGDSPINVKNGSLTMAYFNNCHFKNNHAIRGGAISVLDSDDSGLFLNGCTFTGNWIDYKDGTTIFVKNAGFLCMNNCTIADDTYADTAGGNASWIYADNLANGLIISNCTLIGSARYSGSKTVDDTPTPLVKMANLANDKNYLINDIIIGEESHYSFGLTAGTAHTVNLDCTKFGTANMAVGSIAGTYDEGHSRGDFGVIEWDATDLIWKWNGTVAGANDFQITAADFSTAINSANSNFKTWLQDIECINKDQLGSTRPGSGVWMPGAYQK